MLLIFGHRRHTGHSTNVFDFLASNPASLAWMLGDWFACRGTGRPVTFRLLDFRHAAQPFFLRSREIFHLLAICEERPLQCVINNMIPNILLYLYFSLCFLFFITIA